MFTTTLSQAGAIFMALVCGSALLKGRAPERIAAGALIFNWVGCAAVQDRRLHHHAQPAIFAIDLAYDALLLWLLVTRERTWLVFAFAYQTLIVLTHLASAADPQIGQWDFFIAYYVWSYAVLAAVAYGALVESRSPVGRQR